MGNSDLVTSEFPSCSIASIYLYKIGSFLLLALFRRQRNFSGVLGWADRPSAFIRLLTPLVCGIPPDESNSSFPYLSEYLRRVVELTFGLFED